MPPLDDLLIEHVQPAPGCRCLFMTQGQGQMARAFAGAYPASSIDVIEVDFPSRQLMAQLDERKPLLNLTLLGANTPFPDAPLPGSSYDEIVIVIPKGRLLARRWLVQASTALSPAGRLALAGPKDLGIQSVAHDAEALFGEKGAVLGYKKGQRIIAFVRPALLPASPAWFLQPGIAPGTWASMTVDTPAGQFDLKTLPGVFAFDSLDEGSRLLIENLQIAEDDNVLDLGCGLGVIGIFAARRGAQRVELVDSNLLAVAAVRRNLCDLGLAQAHAYAGNVLSETGATNFSLIASNPPFHAGKMVDYHAAEAFIRQGRQVLAPGGRMVIVANRFIRYDRLMAGLFSSVETLAVTSRFYVLCGRVK